MNGWMDEGRQNRKTVEQMSAAVGQYASRQEESYPLVLLDKRYLVNYRSV